MRDTLRVLDQKIIQNRQNDRKGVQKILHAQNNSVLN